MKVAKVYADSIQIMSNSGVARIPFVKLPPYIQKQFNIDPTKAAELRKREMEAQVVKSNRLKELNDRRNDAETKTRLLKKFYVMPDKFNEWTSYRPKDQLRSSDLFTYIIVPDQTLDRFALRAAEKIKPPKNSCRIKASI